MLLVVQDELIEKMKSKLAELGATVDEPPPTAEVRLLSSCFSYDSWPE